jgi:hypothetical protein
MFYLKKYIVLIVAFSGIFFTLNAQVSVGIAGTVTITPGNTVANATPVSFIGDFKNTSSAPLTATVVMNLAINTSTAAIPNYVFRNSSTYTVAGLAAGGTHSFSISDVASTANQYETDGNGTTVVVWPYVAGSGSVSTSDSAFTVIYINTQAGVEEINEFESTFLKIENPVTKTVILQYDPLIYRKVELVDMNGKVIETIENSCLTISGLAKGLYYLNYHNSKTGRVVVKKILVQ